MARRIFACDFETTVYEGQEYTEVWSSAFCELYEDNVVIHHSIDETFNYFKYLDGNILLYYHNLKFDGAFWIDYLLNREKFKQAYEKLDEEGASVKWIETKFMKNNTFKYLVSEMGQWYTITIKVNNKIIEIRDSYKLLPFTLEKIGKSFETKHKKLTMKYEGFRYAGCEITDEEKEYIKNDIYVLKEALEITFNEGHNRLTIGSCCFAEFRKTFDKVDFKTFFPDVYDFSIDKTKFKYSNAGEYIRRSYRGGWCYLAKGKENKIFHDGITVDVNSLYPSVMHSISGNRYPVGKPEFWSGNYIPEKAQKENKYYFVRINCRFKLKEGYLPFIQIKGNYLYDGTENLESSDIKNRKTGTYHRYWKDIHGVIHDSNVTMTMTMTDYTLFLEHYEVYDLKILDGCYFASAIGLFDEYLNKYKGIKETSTGAIRELAKLFMNNLYGKLASNNNSTFKVAYVVNGVVKLRTVEEHNKKAGYIPCGSAITSYARDFTIRHAQKNYYGANNKGFIYADTDSIHCDLDKEDLKDIVLHQTNFCAWKIESEWEKGLFVRQKTYIEKTKGGEYDVKCAGMPKQCKELFIESFTEHTTEELEEMKKGGRRIEEIEFLKTTRSIEDFKIGLLVYGKLLPKRIRGGIILVPTTYEMR